jgi:hypothetical protein
MSFISGPDATGTMPRRRNGRRPACEPCRRRKVACDQRAPACSRCLRQGVSGSCVYMVGQIRPRRPHIGLTQRLPEVSTQDRTADVPALSGNNIGYLGATNFSSVFRDSPHLLDQGPQTPGVLYSAPAHAQLEAAVAILRLIPDRATCLLLLRSHLHCSDGWSTLAAQLLNESVWIAFGSTLEQSQRPIEALTRIAYAMFHNDSTTFREDHTNPMEWLQSFSGSNLRWESLGILFAYWALGSKSLISAPEQRETDTLRSHDRMGLIMKYKNGARMCIDLCQRASSSNTLLACLLHKYSILESVVFGDTSTSWLLLFNLRI